MKAVFITTPIPKPRITHMGKMSLRAKRYYSYADELRWVALAQGYEPTSPLSIKFYLPMPMSWSKKKKAKMVGTLHQEKPDLDNLIKAFKDALLKEDSAIAEYGHMGKYWAEEGRIEVW